MLVVNGLGLKKGDASDLPRFSVDLVLPAGECLGLHGESGVGKSLLLRALADLDPHEGEVSLRGRSQNAMAGPEWRKRVQWVPAESGWWADRVGDHFSGQEDVDWARLGFDQSVLDWEVARLSSGERQRLALLRSWQLKPDVWLLDEPTSALDRENVERLEGWVGDLRRENELAVIWVSHDHEQLSRVADRVMRLGQQGLESVESVC